MAFQSFLVDSAFETATTAMYLQPFRVFAVCHLRLVWNSAVEGTRWRFGLETFFVCSKRCDAMIARVVPSKSNQTKILAIS